jgi:Putative lumazine-binding
MDPRGAYSHVVLDERRSTLRFRRVFRVCAVPAIALSALAVVGCADSQPSEDERAVTEVVERFLRAAGRYDLDSLPLFFAPDANVGAASLRENEWVTSTLTFDEWYEFLGTQTKPRPYTEPVSDFTVHVENGRLAFVRADAVLIRDGHEQSHNIDYFTLIRLNGEWRILNGSYTSVPTGSP